MSFNKKKVNWKNKNSIFLLKMASNGINWMSSTFKNSCNGFFFNSNWLCFKHKRMKLPYNNRRKSLRRTNKFFLPFLMLTHPSKKQNFFSRNTLRLIMEKILKDILFPQAIIKRQYLTSFWCAFLLFSYFPPEFFGLLVFCVAL